MSVMDVDAGTWKEEVMNMKDLELVEFWHEKCPWCKRLEPILQELSLEYEGKVKFAKLNVLESEENRAIATQHGLMGTPTLIFFCDGKPLETNTGFMPKERLRKAIDDMLERYKDCIEQRTDLIGYV